MEYRYCSVTEQSALRKISTILNSNSIIHIEESVGYLYRPSSACERSAYEALWHQYSTTISPSISSPEESKLIFFALKSGLSMDQLNKCISISTYQLSNSLSTGIAKEDFYNLLRCLSFVQIFGIQEIFKEDIISSKFMDFSVPYFNNISLTSGYPSVFYFPHSKLEIIAYECFWQQVCSMDIANGNEDLCSYGNEINATAAVKFVVASRLKRSM